MLVSHKTTSSEVVLFCALFLGVSRYASTAIKQYAANTIQLSNAGIDSAANGKEAKNAAT